MTLQNLQKLLSELIDHQRKTLLKYAREIVKDATAEDILQPNDFPELENSPHFRYEEGIVAGLQSAESAVNAWIAEQKKETV